MYFVDYECSECARCLQKEILVGKNHDFQRLGLKLRVTASQPDYNHWKAQFMTNKIHYFVSKQDGADC